MSVVHATAEHVPAIAAIYGHAATTSHATFDLTGHPESWWHDALAEADISIGRIVLVAIDDGGGVLGYAKSGRHKPRAAYDTTCETAVYVASSGRGQGVGRALYAALLAELDESPLRLAVAGVAEPNEASTRLHLTSGFAPVGTFAGIGAKRGRAWDVTWYERPLSPPALVTDVRALVAAGAERARIAAAIAERGGWGPVSLAGPGEGAVPILDPADGSELGAIAVGRPLGPGERLLLEWCAEALAPAFSAH
jgi:phosphinothricin acetyltransferase